MTSIDSHFMRLAIQEAEIALMDGLRPFGAVVVHAGNVIGTGRGTGTDIDPTRHSEIIAIQEACISMGGRLHGCWLYSTHEPCAMCAGAAVHAKLERVIWGSCRWRHPGLFTHRTMYNSSQIMTDCSAPVDIRWGVLESDCDALFAREKELLA